jgi:hypothetical protein
MPSKALFQRAKHRLWQVSEIPLFYVTVHFIVRNVVGKNVIYECIMDVEA